ncbi:bile acid:sodium symporter family protein [Agromyces sp. NPDC004153]
MDPASLISVGFHVSSGLTAFAYGLIASRGDLLYVFRRPRLLAVSLLAMFVVVPVLALALDLYFDFPYAARVGLVVLGLTPISAGLAAKEISAGGRAAYAYGLSFAVAVVGLVIVPAMTAFLGDVMGREFSAPFALLVPALIGYVLAPLAVGIVIARLAPKLVSRVREPVRQISNIFLWVALLLTLVLIFPSVISVVTLRTVAAMALFVIAALAIGHAMGGPGKNHAVVLAIACASRNPGLAIGIAAANFPAENFVATMVLYGILSGLVMQPYLRWQTKRLLHAEAPATPAHGAETDGSETGDGSARP